MFPLSSGWFSFPYITEKKLQDFCVDRKTSSYYSLFNMVQIKLSVVFILAAAAIAPILALPLPPAGSEGREELRGRSTDKKDL